MNTTDTPLDAEELADLDADLAGDLNNRWGVPYAVGRHIEAQLERYRNIAIALEEELAETTDRLNEAEDLTGQLRDEYTRARTGWEREGRRAEDMARRNAELRTELDALRAQVAELLRLNTEGRPWQITEAHHG